MTELYLIRHAQQISALETNHRVLADSVDGLTEIGHLQAERLARHVTADIRPAVLYASPLKRAQQTAQHVSQATGLPIHTDSTLAELYLNCPPDATPAIEFDGWVRARRQPHRPAFSGGEALIDLQQRGLQAIDRIAGEHWGEKIVIVAHGGLIEMVFLGLHHIPIESNLHSLIHVTHTGIFCWRWLELASIDLCGWDLLYANDTHHLDGL